MDSSVTQFNIGIQYRYNIAFFMKLLNDIFQQLLTKMLGYLSRQPF